MQMDYNGTDASPSSWLAGFKPPRAKIDFITLRLPSAIRTAADMRRFTSAMRGRVATAKTWRDLRDGWITIHDPHRDDLQCLLDNYPEAEILVLEVAVDLFLKDGTNDPAQLQAAHRHLTINLFPQAHQRLAERARRKIYTDNGLIRPDTMKTGSGGKSVYWADANGREQVRLYVKTLDNKLPVKGQHSTRLEITLNRGGCQNAGINRVCLLPGFAKIVRSYLSPFFKVATGIKPKITRSRAMTPDKAAKATCEAAKARKSAKRTYERYGAAVAAKHGQAIVIDRRASDAVGGALKGLREQLSGLELPNNSAELLERWGAESLMYQGFNENQEPLSIEASTLPIPKALGTNHNQSNIKVVQGTPAHDEPGGPKDKPGRLGNSLGNGKQKADIKNGKGSSRTSDSTTRQE